MNEANTVTVPILPIQGPTSPVPQQRQGGDTPIWALIERASRDPSISMERLEKLIEFADRAKADERKLAFNQAMANAQHKMEPVRKNASNPQTHSKYATYEAIDRDIRPIYTQAGFSVSFNTNKSEKGNGFIKVLAYVSHDEGFEREYEIDMPIVTKGPKGNDVMTETHATGSAYSYGKRYLLCGIFNIAVYNDDDDGNGGRPKQQGEDSVIGDKQVKFISALIESTGRDKTKMLAHFGIEKIEDLSFAQLREATAICNRSKAQQAQAKEPAKEKEPA